MQIRKPARHRAASALLGGVCVLLPAILWVVRNTPPLDVPPLSSPAVAADSDRPLPIPRQARQPARSNGGRRMVAIAPSRTVRQPVAPSMWSETRVWDGAVRMPVESASGLSATGDAWTARGGAPGEDRVLLSRPVAFTNPFNNVVPSWNGTRPRGSKLRVSLRVASADGAWSDWFDMGVWGSPGGDKPASRADDGWGRVNEDMLELARPATQVQFRVTFVRGASSWPSLRLFALCAADTTRRSLARLDWGGAEASDRWLSGASSNAERRTPNAAVALPVPYRSQRAEGKRIASKVCGPTSLSMALEFGGHREATAAVARAAWDARNRIYGNWPFLAAAAGERGATAWMTRFRGLAEIEREISAGYPVILSYAYKAGELDNTPLRATPGHLILVTGFTASGDVIVNDPAGHGPEDGQTVYRRAQVERIWLGRGGVVILVHPRRMTTASVAP